MQSKYQTNVRKVWEESLPACPDQILWGWICPANAWAGCNRYWILLNISREYSDETPCEDMEGGTNREGRDKAVSEKDGEAA